MNGSQILFEGPIGCYNCNSITNGILQCNCGIKFCNSCIQPHQISCTYHNNNNSNNNNSNNIILPSPIKKQPINDNDFFNEIRSNRSSLSSTPPQPPHNINGNSNNISGNSSPLGKEMNDDDFFNEIKSSGNISKNNSDNQIKENLISSYIAVHHQSNDNELNFKNDENGEEDLGDEEFIHIVSEKDTLAGLALKYNCTVEEIKQINKLTSHSIESKYTLVIPNQKSNNNSNNTSYNGEMDDILKKRIVDRFLKNTGCQDRNIAIEYLDKCKYDYFKSIVEYHNSKGDKSPLDDINEVIKDIDSDGDDIDSFFSTISKTTDNNEKQPNLNNNSDSNSNTNNILKNSDNLINQYKDIYNTNTNNNSNSTNNNNNRFNSCFFDNEDDEYIENENNTSFVDKITSNINNSNYFDNNRTLNDSSFQDDDDRKDDGFNSFGDVFNEEFKQQYQRDQQHQSLEQQKFNNLNFKSSKEQHVEETYNINYVTKNFKIEKKKSFSSNYNFRGKKQGVSCCFAFK